MYIRLPIRELIRYSIALSLAITVFFFITMYLQDLDLRLGLYRALLGGGVLFATCLVSILLIIILERKNPSASAVNARIRFCLGSLISVLLNLLYHFCREMGEKYGLLPRELYDFREMYHFHGWQLYLIVFISSMMVYGLVHLLHNFILLQHFKTQAELEVSLLRSVNAETTNQLLKQQVQPHFLFNALNVLKSLIKTNPKMAEAYLVRLSDYLRSSFTQDKKGVATLREEVKLCQDYLEMQKMRFGEALHYQVDIPEKYMESRVPFFSLQPLAENAIKHNHLTEERPLSIRMEAGKGLIKVSNNIQRKSIVDNSTGKGLANLAERYRLLSGDNIQIMDDGITFCVAFKTLKNEHRHY